MTKINLFKTIKLGGALIAITAFFVVPAFPGIANAETLVPAVQDITYNINDDIGYYNVQNSGNRVFNWNVDVTHRGPGGMHIVTIGHYDDSAGSAPTISNPFGITPSGKLEYRNPVESGSFNFSFDTSQLTCGRVQIDGSFIDERYAAYNDKFLFFAIVIDYGVDCGGGTPPPPPPPPSGNVSCELFANPSSISNGDRSVLTWTKTGDITFIRINNGIGGVSLSDTGVGIFPTETTTYTMTVGNNDYDATCHATVTVGSAPPPPPPPPPADPSCDAFSASPSSIVSGSSSTLTWETTNATAVSINHGIGNVAKDGSKTVSPTVTTTYTLSVLGSAGGIDDVCTAKVIVTPVPLADVSIVKTVTPSTRTVGGLFTYTLTYRNLGNTDALNTAIADVASPIGKLGSYTITKQPDHGSCIAKTNGITCSLGTVPVGATGTIKYTATALSVGTIDNTAIIHTSTPETDSTNNQDDARVIVNADPVSVSCDSFIANPTSIFVGSSSTLGWETTDAVSVTINGSSKPVDGSMTVTPLVTTTYNLIATDISGRTDTCSVEIVVDSPTTPSCTLTLGDLSIIEGNSSSLSWTTTNAISASMVPDLGPITPLAGGSFSIMPTANTTYTMTVTSSSGSTAICEAAIIVTPPAPSCVAFIASPSVGPAGTTFDLDWTVINATSVSIDNSIGVVTPVTTGTHTVSDGVTTDTTYILTATGLGGTTTCPASFDVSTTPLADVSIIKSVTPASALKGSIFTYTLTYRNTGNVDALNVTIEDDATPGNLVSGFNITKQPDHGTCTTKTDGISCSIGTLPVGATGTIEYKLTGDEVGVVDNTAVITTTTAETNTSNNSDSEQISIYIPTTGCQINCGGGGIDPPTVVMFMKSITEQPFASQSFIYLSQVPYTGVVGDNAKMILFVVLLTIWSALAAYFIIKRYWGLPEMFTNIGAVVNDPYNRSSSFVEERAMNINEILEKKNPADNQSGVFTGVFKEERETTLPPKRFASIAQKPSFIENEREDHGVKEVVFNGNNLPVEEAVGMVHEERDLVKPKVDMSLELQARERGILCSPDALGLLSIPMAQESNKEQSDILDSVINAAGGMYPRDDGWIVLDKKRLEGIILSPRFSVISIFADWLSKGESQKIFAFVRLLRTHKISIKSFLKKVAYYIDNLYRCRIGESLDEDHSGIDLENQYTNWSTKDIQKCVGILVDGVDDSYESEDASVKLALVKVLETSERAQIEGKSYYKN